MAIKPHRYEEVIRTSFLPEDVLGGTSVGLFYNTETDQYIVRTKFQTFFVSRKGADSQRALGKAMQVFEDMLVGVIPKTKRYASMEDLMEDLKRRAIRMAMLRKAKEYPFDYVMIAYYNKVYEGEDHIWVIVREDDMMKAENEVKDYILYQESYTKYKGFVAIPIRGFDMVSPLMDNLPRNKKIERDYKDLEAFEEISRSDWVWVSRNLS